VREKFIRRGIPAIFSIHDEQDGNGNFHVHVTSFYRQLTPEGWARRKQRPFGKLAWRDYWADGAQILRNIQLRFLSRLGLAVERPQRLAMLPNPVRPSRNNPDEGALSANPFWVCGAPSESREGRTLALPLGQCGAEITKGAARPVTAAAPVKPIRDRQRGQGAYRPLPRAFSRLHL